MNIEDNGVLVGDYEGCFVAFGTYIQISKTERAYIASSTVESVEVIDSEEKLSKASVIGRGIIGQALLGNAGAFYGMMTAKNKVLSYMVYIKFKDGKECIVRLSPTFYNNMKAKFNSKALNKLANK